MATGAAALLHFRNRAHGQADYRQDQARQPADTGFFYVTKKNPRTKTEKLSFKKYDPIVRKHVDFKEAKIK